MIVVILDIEQLGIFNMLQSIFWGSVLYGDHSDHIHRGHITTSPPIDSSYLWILSLIFFLIPFIVIGIPIIAIWWDIKKHPNKPIRKVAKK